MTKKAVVTNDGLQLVNLSKTEKDLEKLKVTQRNDNMPEKLKSGIRATRQPLFEEADIEIFKLEDSGGDTSAWRTYRQQLRDVTKQSDLNNISWPSKP